MGAFDSRLKRLEAEAKKSECLFKINSFSDLIRYGHDAVFRRKIGENPSVKPELVDLVRSVVPRPEPLKVDTESVDFSTKETRKQPKAGSSQAGN